MSESYETKALAAKLSTADALGTFDGDGAVFNEFHPTSAWNLPSDWKDTIKPGAFRETLGKNLPALVYQHDLRRPIGVYTDVHEDKQALRVAGKLAINATDGRDAYELMKLGALDGLSIGFKPTKVALNEKDKVREILSVELYEISPVTIPAIANARINNVKSGDPHNIRFLEKILRDAGLSREEAKALLADGHKALRDAEVETEYPTPETSSLRDAAALLSAVKKLRL